MSMGSRLNGLAASCGLERPTPRRLNRCFCVMDLRAMAMRRLPAPIFHYLEGGSDDEVSLSRNTSAFDHYELSPEQLRDVRDVDLSISLLGRRVALPLILSPTGMSRLFHHEAERAVARAAERAGVFYSLSTLGTTSLEDVAAVNHGPKIFQIYILKDRDLTKEFVIRSRASGYDALCLTIDTPIVGNRERDRVTGMTIPPRFSLRGLGQFAMRPCWTWNLLRHPQFQLANVVHRVGALSNSLVSLIDYVSEQMDRSLGWADVEWLAAQWSGPFIVKGIQSTRDAKRAVAAGASALMLSNHGGRQLDGVSAPIDLLAEVRDAVGDRIELILDGGVRRGSHIVKALALGANACSIGRPYLYGLAAGGQTGVEHGLSLFRSELERDLVLLGCAKPADVRANHIRAGRGAAAG
jgi:L-lactate dehydrogenase (cytochrome)